MSKSHPPVTRIAIARIIKERGIKGEVKALPLSETARHIPSGSDIQVVLPNGSRETRTIRSVRHDRGSLLISLHGISRREEAAALRNGVIEVDSSLLPPLPADVYYHEQIAGLLVVTVQGIELGTITGIMETGGADVYVVKGGGKEYLIPAVKDVVTSVDLGSGTMIITPFDGLLG